MSKNKVEEFLANFESGLTGDACAYYRSHKKRYLETIAIMPSGEGFATALDIGGTSVYAYFLYEFANFKKVDMTKYSPDKASSITSSDIAVLGKHLPSTAFHVDLEKVSLPIENGSYDLVLLCEVIEHFAVDPLFALAELNRVLRIGGQMILTTPNACSARSLFKLVNLENPDFFLCYSRNGSSDRHNLEYSPNLLTRTLHACGFEITQIKTIDVFEPRLEEGYELLSKLGCDDSMRGDDIFVVAQKVSGVTSRFPDFLYS